MLVAKSLSDLQRRRKRRSRSGSAVLELAVCLPMLSLLVFGTIETCSMIYVRETLTVGCYEGIRVAIKRGKGEADATARVQEVLATRNVKQAAVSYSTANLAQAAPGTEIRIQISVPCAANSILPPQVFAGRSIVASATMTKE